MVLHILTEIIGEGQDRIENLIKAYASEEMAKKEMERLKNPESNLFIQSVELIDTWNLEI